MFSNNLVLQFNDFILAKSKPSPGIKAQVLKDKEEREAIVLWRQPVNTLYNATLEIITLSISGVKVGIKITFLYVSLKCTCMGMRSPVDNILAN